MVLGVSVLLLGALFVYAGLHGESVKDVLKGKHGVFGQNFPSNQLANTPAGGSGGGLAGGITGALTGAAGAVSNALGGGLAGSSTHVANHPELHAAISQVTNAVLSKFPQLQITSTTGGTHAAGSYHYQGRAVDLAADSSTMLQAAGWISANIASSLVEGIHNPNLSIKNGKQVSPTFWGAATWGAHANHIHLAA